MKDCKEFWGDLFGHKFTKYLVKKGYQTLLNDIEINCTGDAAIEVMEQCRDIYEIRCCRCGCKTEGD